MLVLRVLSAEKSGKNSLDIAGLLKIRGSEIQQRYSELMMLAAGPFALPLVREAMEAGWRNYWGGGGERGNPAQPSARRGVHIAGSFRIRPLPLARGGGVGQNVLLRQEPPPLLLAAGLASLLPLCFFLLMGDLAWSLKERAVQEVVKAQLREFSQHPVLLNVLFGALPALLSLLFGPLVGAWSDRTRTRLGRRIPFLLCGAPLLSGSLVGLAYSEALADAVLAWFAIDAAYRREAVIACMGVFWALFELFSITGNALFIALVNDTVPKPLLGRFFGLFRIVSLAVGAAFFYVVFGNELPSVARQVMLAIAGIYLAGFAILCAFVREPDCPPPSALERGAGQVDGGDPAVLVVHR
eukprot:gene46643-58159_t